MTSSAPTQDFTAVMKNALQQIRELKAKLAEAEKPKQEPIAIIGVGCRFPQGSRSQDIHTPDQFWTFLCNGGDAITETPTDRWDVAATFDPDPSASGKTHIRHGGFLAHVDGFEPQFFNLAPREAITLDPQQRLLLETSWEALEHAHIVPNTLVESATGVFIGISGSDYGTLLARNDQLAHPEGQVIDDLYGRTGVDSSVAAGRLSYVLGLTGPCIAVDTACSSSLVAIHQACQSLRQQECDLALAGGVALMLSPENTIAFSKAGMLSADGRCKTFDAAADGYVRGEGCGMVVLKRLADAQAAGDPILAVIRGSMINHDGPSSGLTVPRGPSQQAVIRQALSNADIAPAAVSYIEAHGTGTPLGDPIELGALRTVFRTRTTPLWVGSVKTNLGHLEAAAGIASLIKVVLMVQHEQIPPHLHFQTPNPHIDWANAPFQIPTELTDWAVSDPGAERIAGISSFGYSGTNAHVILSSPPVGQRTTDSGQKTEDKGQRTKDEGQPHLLTIAAKSAAGVQAYVQRYRDFLTQNPALALADLCYSSQVARTHFPYRVALPVASVDELQTRLADLAHGEMTNGITTGYANPDQPAPKIGFLFTGQGAQYVNMGRELYATNPIFRAALDRCEALYQAETGESLLAVLYPATTTDDGRPTTADERSSSVAVAFQARRSSIDETTYTQPALFALEYALAQVWLAWGVKPDLLLGHSIGEVAAACVAGVFSLADGIKLVTARGRLMGALPQDGTMIAVTVDEAEAQRLIAPYADRVAIAAINGPQNLVLSGQRAAIDAVVGRLSSVGAPAKIKHLTVSHAFHSPLMEPMLDPFRQVAQTITYHAPQLPLVSNVTGQLASLEITTPEYWVRHVRDTVRFADGVATLEAQGIDIFLEIGPQPVLLGLATSLVLSPLSFDQGPLTNDKGQMTNDSAPTLLPSLRQHHSDGQQMLTSLGELYVRGVSIDWAGVQAGSQRRKVLLPTYPFQRQRYWIEQVAPITGRNEQASVNHWFSADKLAQLTERIAQRDGLDAAQRALVSKVLTALTAESRTQQMMAQVEALLYEVAWEHQPLPLPVQPPTTPGRWLLVADAYGIGAALAARLTALGEQVDLVASGDANVDLAEHMRAMAAAETKLPLRGIVHLGALDTGMPDDVTSLLQDQQRTLTSILTSVQTLATLPTAVAGVRPRLWLATRGGQALTRTEAVAFAQTPVWGLGRVIALEHGEVWGGLVDLAATAAPTASADALLAEIVQSATPGETQVAYRDQTRYVARLVRSQLKNATQPTVAIHADATYLITGGLGALGLLVAEWLTEQGAKQLILTGRRGITTAAQQTAVDQLVAKGVTIQVAQVDVADEAAMRTLFAQIAASGLSLKGVIHTAGVLDDAILLNQQWSRFATVLAPKVAGGWLLHHLTETLDLDFLVFFSSITALLGNAGQGNYAAANAFLDGLAQYRQQQGLPALSINWDAWADAGMAARTLPPTQEQSQPIAPAVGLMALARLLTPTESGRSQISVTPIDWSTLVNANRTPTPFFANFVTPQVQVKRPVAFAQELAALPVSRRLEQLQHYLQKTLQRVLGMTELPLQAIGFADLGMDSLMALELRRQLEQELGHTLPTTIAFEYPTVEKLASYLFDLLESGEWRVESGHADSSLQSPVSTLALPGLHEPIAVISMACRFPGANTPEAFWQLLANGVDMVQEVPASRWPIDAFYDPQRPRPGKTYTRAGAFLDQVDQFDPMFFGIAPREAVGMDPQHRLLLETSWEALERAGIAQRTLIDSRTGVFVGIGEADYTAMTRDALGELDTHAATNSGPSIAAGRLAYTLGLQGPTLAVDTACSSSLVALHLASQSLRTGECELALAGGINLMLSPSTHVAMSQMQALAPDGRCKTFAAAADGYGRGEGCGMVLLKRLSDAQRDGDTILAVIKGSAVNHDGPSSGLTVPNKLAQEKLLRQALVNAQATPDEVTYIEAHGTGTPLGDPIELRALDTVFGNKRATPLLVGSVKTNIGHLEAAAGIAGFIKTVLALQHRQLPAHLHFDKPNPYIEWDQLAIAIPTTLQPWPCPTDTTQCLAGISAFGISGTNAHIVVATTPVVEGEIERLETGGWGQQTKDKGQRTKDKGRHLLPLSAKTPAALTALTQRYVEHLQLQPELDLGDLCYTAASGRNLFPYRLAIVATDSIDLQDKLGAVPQHSGTPAITQGTATARSPRLAFLFTGQGAQYVDMGRELYATNPTFRAALDRCEALYQAETGESLLAVLYPEPTTDDRRPTTVHPPSSVVGRGGLPGASIDETTYTQPALFALEVALAQVWLAWGVKPDLLLGHSVGEVAAACVAGVFTLEDGMKLITARGRLMGALPQDGTMIAVTVDEAQAQSAIAPVADRVSIAAINGPQNLVLSGQRAAIEAVVGRLSSVGAPAKIKTLTVSHAFHSPLMEPMLDAFREVAQTITYHAPQFPLVSNVTGMLAGAEITTPEYWVRHVRDTVRFADGVATLQAQDIAIFVEIGPQPVLLGLATSLVLSPLSFDQGPLTNDKGPMTKDNTPTLLPSLRANQPDEQQMLTSLGEMYVRGVSIDWAGVHAGSQRRKVLLPTYPFQRQRYWIEPAPTKRRATALGPLIDKMIKSPVVKETLFETALSLANVPFLTDHRIEGMVVAPGACHLAMLLSAAELAFGSHMYHLSDVMFPQPLALRDDETRTAQIILTPAEVNGAGPHATVRLISFDERDPDTALTTHATGAVEVVHQLPAASRPLSAVQTRCTEDIALTSDQESALQFGPAFQWLEAAWQPSGQTTTQDNSTSEVLVKLRRPEVVTQVTGYRLHPGLLDGCFQAVGLIHGPSLQTQDLYLPFAVAALSLYQTAEGDTWWCHIQQVDTEKWNIWLYDQAGQLIAAIDEFQLRAVPQGALHASRVRTDWLFTLAWQTTPLPAPQGIVHAPACWLLMGDAGERNRTLAAQLQTLAPAAPLFYALLSDAATSGAAIRQLVTTLAAQHRSVGVVYLSPVLADQSTTPVPMQTLDLASALLHLTQALLDSDLAAQLWLVTVGSQAVAGGSEQRSRHQPNTTTAAAGALWGLGRTLMQEQPNLHTVCIDLAPDVDIVQQATWIRQEVAAGLSTQPTDSQIAYRNGTRYVAQLQPWHAPVVVDQTQPMRLQLQAYGSLDNLQWVPLVRRQPGPGEIEVEVKAAGLNFRDVLNALGMLQEYYAKVLGITQAQEVGLGFECAGVVTAVGDGVSGLAVGDRVMGLGGAAGTFASYITVPASQMTLIPDGISDVEAATIPLTFLTAWYGLVELAKLQPGERILIHAAAGGVGQAAVQIAQAIGAEIFATASPGKWPFLRQQGLSQIMNSRTLAFAEEMQQSNGGRGVDVVLNSLNGPFIEQSFAVLGQRGRFVEIGKIGIWGQEEVAQRRPDVAYYPFDLGEALDAEPTLSARLWHALSTAFKQGMLRPLPYRAFPAQESSAAFRYMQQAKQTGKVVLTFTQSASAVIHSDATYLITGGLGALGLQIAQQLVADGARHLVLSGRRGATTTAQEQALADLATTGADIHVVPTDMADRAAVQMLLDRCTQIAPLRGIVHAAGLLDDGIVTAQTRARLTTVMQPKVDGAWHLHTLTTDGSSGDTLDFFVCFSSAAALLGSPGQSNYAAANAFLDTLMHERRQLGLPGLSIDWGPWAEIGMAAGLQAQLHAQGMAMIAPAQGRLLFHYLLQQAVAQIGVLPLRRAQPTSPPPAQRLNQRERLANLPAAERHIALERYLRGEIATVLGLHADTLIDAQTRLFDLGFDSLMAVEMKNKLEAGLACSLRSTLLFDYPTLSALTPYLLNHVLGLAVTPEKEVTAAPPIVDTEPAVPAELDELLDEEISELLLAKLDKLGF